LSTSPSSAQLVRWAPRLNLLLPGGGQILLGFHVSGLLRGVLFTVAANYCVYAVFIVPDLYSRTVQALLIGLVAGAYVGAQLRMAGNLRELRERERVADRDTRLRVAQAALAEGEVAAARKALAPLAPSETDDLLVAVRWAQALTAAGDAGAADAAWQRVRELDRHGIYRTYVREYRERRDASAEASATESRRSGAK
jgi:hypothetical protein